MDWLAVATNLGIPSACLLALGTFVWRVSVWLGKNVIEPVTARHIKFLDDLSTAVVTQSQAMTAQSHAMTVQSQALTDQSEAQKIITEQQGEMISLIKIVIKQHDTLIRPTDPGAFHAK